MNSQNLEMSKNENWNCVQAQECKEMTSKAADILVENDGKLDTTPILTNGNNPIFSHRILPVNNTVRGTLIMKFCQALVIFEACNDCML